MNPDELFDKFQDLLLSSFRKQMLLGSVPADTVERILEPLLSNFYGIMLWLPPELQADFENILRLYPDVAERFGVRINPPVVESLRRLAQYWRDRLKKAFNKPAGLQPLKVLYQGGPESDEDEIDDDDELEDEPQRDREVTKKSVVNPFEKVGQGFFTTDRGNPVYIEFSYSEEGDFAHFEYRPPVLNIEIHICEIYTLTLTPQSPKQEIPVESLFEILAECAGEVEIKIIELS